MPLDESWAIAIAMSKAPPTVGRGRAFQFIQCPFASTLLRSMSDIAGLAAGATPQRDCQTRWSDAIAAPAKGRSSIRTAPTFRPETTYSQSAAGVRLALVALPLLSRSPTVRARFRCHPGARTASHVRRWGTTLSVLAHVYEYAGALHLPRQLHARISARQDSKTRRLLS